MGDADATEAQQASAARWGGVGFANELAQVLALVLPLVAVDDRCSCACVSRAWREAAAAPPLWAELEFSRCTARVSAAALMQLCARAGAALRDLRLDAPACAQLNGGDFVDALIRGGCAGVRRIHAQTRFATLSLSHEQARELAAAFPQLEHVACSVNSCGGNLAEAAGAAAALPGPKTLLHLVGHDGLTAPLFSALPSCVTELGVDGSRELQALSEATADALTEALLHGNTTLTGLRLTKCGVKAARADALAGALYRNITLQCLHLDGDAIRTTGCFALAELLRYNTTLTALNLERGYFNTLGATALTNALCDNATLRKLALPSNEIGMKVCTVLAVALHSNATLTELHLNTNKIGDEGAVALAGALLVNASLLVLDLRDNDIGDAGAATLADALRMNTALTCLDTRWNDFGSDGAAALAEAARGHATLRELKLNQ